MVGFYVDGGLEGEGRITHEEGGTEEVQFRRGCVHGLARRLDAKGEVVWVGNYHLGQQSGVSWAFLSGGGILVAGLFLASYQRKDKTEHYISVQGLLAL